MHVSLAYFARITTFLFSANAIISTFSTADQSALFANIHFFSSNLTCNREVSFSEIRFKCFRLIVSGIRWRLYNLIWNDSAITAAANMNETVSLMTTYGILIALLLSLWILYALF